MTEIRESHFAIDLPGAWAERPSDEPGVQLYEEQEGGGRLVVTLLAVRPMFAIADQQRLLQDYMQHRSKFEQGQVPTLVQSEPGTESTGEQLEGEWTGLDLDSGRRTLHRVVLTGGLLAHFAFQSAASDEEAFFKQADSVFASATVTAP